MHHWADYDRSIVIDDFSFQGFHGQPARCALEILPLSDGRTAVIATELEDNPGTSITNVAEHLASHVCDRFGIAPEALVWIEHYGYPPPGSSRKRTYDLVKFRRRPCEPITWASAILRWKPNDWPGHFEKPDWRPMTGEDWKAMGLPPRADQ